MGANMKRLFNLDDAKDARVVIERQWRHKLEGSKPQIPCDVGLFGDEHLQLDLVEMLQDPDPQ